MPADARREPPSEARHGHGRPPDGPPDEEPWGFARGFRSLFQWPQQNAAPPLPPLTASGLRGLHEDGDHDGGVHRLAVTSPGLTQANAYGLPVPLVPVLVVPVLIQVGCHAVGQSAPVLLPRSAQVC